MSDGTVVLAKADAQGRPGHREWLKELNARRVRGEFSVLAKKGRIEGFFPLSALNPSSDARLPQEWIDQIFGHLGGTEDTQVFD